MNHTAGHRLFIQKTDLTQAHIGTDPDTPAARALAPGQARLAVERFALTANNITYAAFGEAMKYWQFFPSGDAALGCLPVWGFATVEESLVEGLPVGKRVWGYYPAGSHLVVAPNKGVVSHQANGFVDGSAHRQDLALVYNQYGFCDSDPGWKPELEGLQAVLRPLFMTAYLIDDFLADAAFFGATQVVLSSASSKTAMAAAHCLAQRRGTPGAPKIIGLTSAAHLDFVRSLGCYDQVALYDTLTDLPPNETTVYVDFAGSAPVRRAVHTHWGERLRYSSSIGGTHWESLGTGSGSGSGSGASAARDLPGPKPTLFFAPAQIKKRSAPPPEGWGAAELQRRMGAGWVQFITQVAQGGWVQIVEQSGPAAVLQAYGRMVAGQVPAREGLMLRM